jgi:hypothetical protein
VRDGAQANAHLGAQSSAAGDVNGDGFGDLLVVTYVGGANSRVDLFLGSVQGLSSTASWSTNLQNYGYSRPASRAGDVNGDGFDDVIVASPLRVFLGGPDGLGTQPAWTGSLIGSVNAAGDLDGDGYSDVVVSDYDTWYQNMPYAIGEAWIFRGNASGLEAQPHWHVGGTDLLPQLKRRQFEVEALIGLDFLHRRTARILHGSRQGRLDSA